MLLKEFTLLYVEDNYDIQESLKLFFENEVKEFYQAFNGQEGLSIYKDKNPDIIIADINMPIMDGLEMSKLIKRIDKNQPILLLSAFQDIDTLTKAIDLGIDKFIPKPIKNIEEMLNTLKSIAINLQNEKDIKILKNKLTEQSKLAAMGEMIGNIAHQWRQPLSVISTGATGMLMQKQLNSLSDELFIQTCNTINKNAQNLSQTIDNFNNFIKESGEKTIFNLKSIIIDILNLDEESIKNHNLNILLDLDKNINIESYKNELIQSIISIFNNAKDVLAKVENKDNKFIFISTSIQNDKVSIKIKDSGGGIPEDIISKVFEPYFTTKHQFQGTGLGLNMTYRLIVDYMNGDIKVTNETYTYNDKEYTGAEFTIQLDTFA